MDTTNDIAFDGLINFVVWMPPIHFHEICKHQQRGITVNTIRIHGYWIMSLISSVAAAIHNCITCRKLYKNTMEQQMSNLPSNRVNEAPPFSYSAVDIFGPYLVKLEKNVKTVCCTFYLSSL